MNVRVERYHSGLEAVWNDFVRDAKNGTLLFDRNYLNYHSDRFIDHSLLFYKGDELMCMLPANEKEQVLYSHGGITFGGLIMSRRVSVVFVLEVFRELLAYLTQQQFTKLIYKAVPAIYHRLAAQEDLYALFRFGSELYRRDVNSVIDLSQKISYTKGTKSNLSKARKNTLTVQESSDFDLFFDIQTAILQAKYNTRPTHTAAEMRLLAGRFPESIKLYLVYKESACLGGTIVYGMGQVLHTQYIGITDAGKDVGALDFLMDHLIQQSIPHYKYFSFGISTEKDGAWLNEGLVTNKESFGARTITNDFYSIAVQS